MRRLPGILLIALATLVVIVALLVSGLRLVLPHLDKWRPQLLAQISQIAGRPVDASQLKASWQNFGPTLEIRDLKTTFEDNGQLSVKRISLAFDVWQSLLHLRPQFRELTFWQLKIHTDSTLQSNDSDDELKPDRVGDLFLRQFDHFTLRDSQLSFMSMSGQRIELAIPQLTWLNGKNRHRAEGELSLSSLTGQHGVMKVRMDMRDSSGLLNEGRVWLQADDIDVKPWLNKWTQDNVALTSARFSLEGWLTLDKSDITSGDVWLKKGGAGWQGANRQQHTLLVDNLTTHVSREGDGWAFHIPDTRIAIDGQRWPRGALAMAWFPGKEKDDGEVRIRASNLELGGLAGLLPIAEKISPSLGDIWQTTQPHGKIDMLALDIPLQAADKTRFKAAWSDLAWKQWKLLPGAEHFSGEAEGSAGNGILRVSMQNAVMPYETVFRAPLEISKGVATLNWVQNEKGFMLDGRDIDVQAKAVRACGGFRWLQPEGDAPWLGILAGISTDDGGQAWRYFPENLMGKDLVDYLSGAIQGGQADSATLVYSGNPHLFPYKHNEGQFQVWVPLHNATFAFQPGWPALTNLNIDLNFLNDGLWMQADKVALGGVTASDLHAAIPDYSKHKLIIDSDIRGPGKAVGPYFQQTPLKKSLGATLDELQLDGDVSARLHLDIPLNGEQVLAKGDVKLANNSLFIKPLNSTLENLSGGFTFENGNLQSGPLSASWFHQPLNVDFSTREGDKAYQVAVNLNGNWQPAKTGLLPQQINDAITGSVPWQGKVGIDLPYKGSTRYKVDIAGDLKNVSSRLPAPVSKAAGDPLPVKVNVSGGLDRFDLTGSVGDKNHLNSRWRLDKKLVLDRGIWTSDSRTLPPLPDSAGLELNLPAMDGMEWLALFRKGAGDGISATTSFPGRITLRTPALSMGGQQWNNLSIVSEPVIGGTKVEAQSREINGSLTMRDSGPWLAAISYLYYNPSSSSSSTGSAEGGSNPFGASSGIDFKGWPNLQLRCAECWLWGQKYGRINGDFTIKGDTLSLSNGLVDTGFARLTTSGEWVNAPGGERSALKGKLSGKKIDTAVSFFGLDSPIRDSSFDVDYDLHWRAAPWTPDVTSLNGIIKTHFGKGEFTDISTGHTGQLLRLVSFDALLRKLRFDFSDTFSEGFYYDSVHSTAWIKDGKLHTDDTLVDGLEADIGLKGSVDLVQRRVDMEAIVAPEISTTVGVATAFVINPIVGAAVFAASKVLGPLWNKVSILRYRITGPIDQPQINEVLRQARSDKTQ